MLLCDTFDVFFEMAHGAVGGHSNGNGRFQLFGIDIDEEHLDAETAGRVQLKLLTLADHLQEQVELVGGADAFENVVDGVIQSAVPAAVDRIVKFVIFD